MAPATRVGCPMTHLTWAGRPNATREVAGRCPRQTSLLNARQPGRAAQGDNDPVDVVEIGEQQLEMGGVYAVKPLAVLAMIDDGELDWKIVAIRADDPRAASVNDVEDVERRAPGAAPRSGGCGRGGGAFRAALEAGGRAAAVDRGRSPRAGKLGGMRRHVQ